MMAANAPSLNILLISGERERALVALNLAGAALALGRPASLFLTGAAMARFASGDQDAEALPAGQPAIAESLAALRTQGLRLYACSATVQMLGLDAGSLAPRVDGIAGAASFLDAAATGQLLSL